jgi:predicted RNA-binding Zn-ribbon protein involved in translation (DUF1610 family)
MAIKRPTKSRGTPSHQPVASAPLRHVDVKAPQQMVPDEIYVDWLCKNRSCGLVIAIAATASGGKALTDFDDQLTAIKCPHCGDEDLYRWSARSEQKYTAISVGTGAQDTPRADIKDPRSHSRRPSVSWSPAQLVSWIPIAVSWR